MRIKFCRMAKEARRLFMVERVDQAQSLVEKLLRGWVARRDGVMQGAQTGDQSHGLGSGGIFASSPQTL
jgi:hypothetical protein